jgi:tetratricopeptide (TPR) repeat protein
MLASDTPAQTSPTGDKLAAEQNRSKRREAYTLYVKAFEAAQRGNIYRAIEMMRQVIELDPTSPEPHVTLGEFHYNVRNTTEARTEAQAALKLDAKHGGAHKLLGRIYRDEALSNGDREKSQQAIHEFEQVVEQDESDIEAWQSLAQLYEITGQQEKLVQALTRWTSNDPTAEPAFYALARYYFSQRKYREAAENASRALAARSAPEHAILLARSLLAQGQTTEALRIYREARKQHADDAELEVNYAEALVYAGQYQEAIATLQRELNNNRQNIEAVRLLAQAYRRSGRRPEAIQALKEALRSIDVTDSLDLQLVLGQTYEETGQIDDAVATYESILDVLLNPDGTVSKGYYQAAEDMLTRIGLVYRDAGRRQDALRAFERMRTVLGLDNPQPDLLIVDTYLNERNYEEALKQAQEAAKRYPQKREFRLLEAQALGNMDRPDEAIRLLDRLLTNSIDDLSVFSTKAQVFTEAERYKEAKAALEEGLRRDPRNPALLIQLSMVQDKLQQPKEAEATLRAILERDPDNQVALNNLGYYLAEQGRQLEEALELIQRAVNIDPTNGSYLDSLGWVYFQMGRLSEAQQYLEQALNYEPLDATIHEHVGDLYQRQGRIDQARRSFERALELFRVKDDRQRVQKKIQQLVAGVK